MEKTVVRKTLPSCRVGRNLIQQLENYFRVQVPKILKDDVNRMVSLMGKRPDELRRYTLRVAQGRDVKEYAAISEYPCDHFDPKTSKATLRYQLGVPVLIEVTIHFERGRAPVVEVSTVQQSRKKLCNHVIGHIRGIIQNWSTKNGLVHNRLFQLGAAVSIPLAMVAYGYFAGADIFFLLASQGWLLLLGLCLLFALKRLFPQVRFETRQRFNPSALLYSAAVAGVLSLIAAYIALLSFELSFTL